MRSLPVIRFLFLLGGLVLAGTPASGAADESASRQRAVDSLFAAASGSPGVAVGIYRHGAVVYERCYGQADLEHGEPITADTVFHVASVSKQFTAFAIALLERDGAIHLDDDVRKYLPYVPDFGHPITVRHLLHHMSGLRDQMELAITRGDTRESLIRQSDVLNLVASQRELNFVPGSEYSYGNTGYTLLAEIVKAASGKTLREFAAARIFAPLGMRHTLFADDIGEVIAGRAWSYARGTPWRRVPLNYETVGATGLSTTLTDMRAWAANFSRPRVGDAALIQHIGTSARTNDGTAVNYGFGFELSSLAGHPAVFHFGYDGGYRAAFAYFPTEDFAIVLLRNDGGDPHSALTAIADLYLNDREQPAPAVPAAIAIARNWLEATPGRYVDRYGKMVSLESRGNQILWSTAAMPATPVIFRADGTFDLGEDQRVWSYYRFKRAAPDGHVVIERSETEGPRTRTDLEPARRAEPSISALAELAGAYRSAELDVTYTLSVEDAHLVARSLRLAKPIVFEPSTADRFDSGGWELSTIRFERDSRGNVHALRAHVGNSRNILFEKRP